MNLLSSRRKIKTRLPFISLFLAVLSLLLYFCSDAAPFLQYERSSIINCEIWRIITCHFTHWSFDHFIWCTITFVALGYICEDISRKGYLATLAIASFVIPAVLLCMDAGTEMYRGLSGLTSATFVFGALMMMHKALKERDWSIFAMAASAGTGYLAKIVFEFISGSALFVKTNEIFAPVPLVHLAGGIVGLLVFLFFINDSPRQSFIRIDEQHAQGGIHRQDKPLLSMGRHSAGLLPGCGPIPGHHGKYIRLQPEQIKTLQQPAS